MGIQVARWDCRYCGHVGNSGPETKCRHCGAPRDEDVEFYLPEDAEYVTDDAILEQAEKGADWNCQYCGADNKAENDKCRSCGNTKSDSDAVRQQKEYELDEVPHSDEDTREKPAPPPAPPQKSGKGLYIGIALLAVILVIVYLVYPRKSTLKVTGMEWTRTHDIEHYQPVEQEGWNLPQGGELIRTFEAVHHYDQVVDHHVTKTRSVKVKVGEEKYVCGKIDMGNGYFKDKFCSRDKYETRQENYQEPVYRKEPRYQTKYVYRIMQWKKQSTETAGGKDKTPKWPKAAPSGKEWREANKTETYILHLSDAKNKQYDIEVDYTAWQKHNIGDTVNATVNALGEVKLQGG